MSYNKILAQLIAFSLIALMLISCKQNTLNANANAKETKHKNILFLINFKGDDKKIARSLSKLKENMVSKAHEMGNEGQLVYWDNHGRETIKKIANSYGYYAPLVSSNIEYDREGRSAVITFDLELGKAYILKEIILKHSKESNKSVHLPSEISLEPGHIAVAENILNGELEIAKQLEEKNCLLSLEVTHKALVNHYDQTLSITYIVNAGDNAYIKSIDFTETEHVKHDYLENLISLKENECFKLSKIIEVRQELHNTGLFNTVSPKYPAKSDKDGTVPVTFKVKDAKQRRIKLGLSYGRDLGAGIKLGWEHKNLFSRGENLAVTSFFNKKEQIARVDFTKPHFRVPNQKLKSYLSYENLEHIAFDAIEYKFYAGLERDLTPKVKASIGGKISNGEVLEPRKKKEKFELLSAPIYLVLDERNDDLDPAKGYYLRGDIEPFKNTKKQDYFTKNVLDARYYLPILNDNKLTLAMRGKIGSSLGSKLELIPATERFYIGGGSSVRGYGFQLAGPVDKYKIPKGGNSFLETSVEFRFKVKEDIGITTFADAGTTYVDSKPNSKQKMLHSYGFGVRYHTDFAPIRLDIAFPSKIRKGVDSNFQIYFGIGQSF